VAVHDALGGVGAARTLENKHWRVNVDFRFDLIFCFKRTDQTFNFMGLRVDVENVFDSQVLEVSLSQLVFQKILVVNQEHVGHAVRDGLQGLLEVPGINLQ